ncbi:MAG TPA: alpha/beta hydrolase family protein [Solirubrobacteraceae bacterium]|nr:alpha/beta hydrolase family protein [Solirubrobacteraceae bacterium]
MPRTEPVAIGLTEAGRTRARRLLTLRLRSRAMGNVQTVDVLLPPRLHRSGHTRYHVLYLLHGAGGDYRSWITAGIEQLLGTLPVIAVMPEGSQDGMDGSYADWASMAPAAGTPTRPVSERAPAWESYHIRELVPFIDEHFPTLAGPAGRAIAGISMGGGGATKYAAEYPGTFGYVGTFSGEAHPLLPIALAFQPKNCRWGNPATDQVVWRDNDSTVLAGNLRGIRVFIRSGDGTPGPFDAPAPPADPAQAAVRQIQLVIEYGAHLENLAFVAALRAAGVSDVDARFFPGSHSLPYWQRDTREFVAWLALQFRRPLRPPAVASIASAHARFTSWGWSFSVHRRVREFLYLRLTRSSIRATGSGTVDVETPPQRPHHRYRVTVGAAATTVAADGSGHVRFRLDLGPSHTHQQTRFGHAVVRTWRTVTATVRIVA